MSHRREILVRHDHNRGAGFQRDIDLGASSEIEAMMKGVAWEQPDDELWEMLQLCYEGLTEIERLSVDAIVFGPHSFRKAAAILGCGVVTETSVGTLSGLVTTSVPAGSHVGWRRRPVGLGHVRKPRAERAEGPGGPVPVARQRRDRLHSEGAVLRLVCAVTLLAGIFIITNLIGSYVSNRASAAIIYPISVTAALQLGLPTQPFILVVAFATAASFITPIGYQTNLMVYGPGGYNFKDYMKIGLPLTVLHLVVTVLVLSWWYLRGRLTLRLFRGCFAYLVPDDFFVSLGGWSSGTG